MDAQNIASTFSPKSDSALSEIMKKYNLGERGDLAELILTKFTMFFSRQEITEKELIESIKKEIGVSAQVAEQIAEEIKSKIIPTLWDKLPKDEREKLLHQKPETTSGPSSEDEEDSVLQKPGLKTETKNPGKIAEHIEIPKKRIVTKKPKHSGPDSYREPLE